MPEPPARFRIPTRVTTRAVLDRLDGAAGRIRAEPAAQAERSWLDSADWRLWAAGWTLEHDRSGVLTLRDRRSELALATVTGAAPQYATDLPKTGPWEGVGAALEGRALINQMEASVRTQRLAALNGDDKTTARVLLSRYRVQGGTPARNHYLRGASVVPIRGYERRARALEEALAAAGLIAGDSAPLAALCGLLGRPEPGARLGPGVDLDRDAPAARAVGLVLGRLREHVVANEAGTRAQLDVEFLHEYRVAVRRARSIVRQAAGVLPPDTVARLAAELGWLGAVTSPVRDLDVHLEELADRAEPEIGPLREHLAAKRDHAQRELVAALDSPRYRRLIEDWGRLAAAPPAAATVAPEARRPAGEVADEHIARAYRRVVKRGRAIGEESPPESLHDLRKRAKELRYLLECFQTLYPDERRGPVVKELKALQDNLGEYQDCQVQAAELRTLAEDLMAARSAPAATLMAMGRLADEQEQRERRARQEFDARFARFASDDNKRRLAELVGAR